MLLPAGSLFCNSPSMRYWLPTDPLCRPYHSSPADQLLSPPPCARRSPMERRFIPSAVARVLTYGLAATRPGIALSLAQLESDRRLSGPRYDGHRRGGDPMAALAAAVLATERQRLPIDVPQFRAGDAGGRDRHEFQRSAAIRPWHDARLRDRRRRRRWPRHAVQRRRPQLSKMSPDTIFANCLPARSARWAVIAQVTLKVKPIPERTACRLPREGFCAGRGTAGGPRRVAHRAGSDRAGCRPGIAPAIRHIKPLAGGEFGHFIGWRDCRPGNRVDAQTTLVAESAIARR